MSDDVITKIIQELSYINYSGKISYHLNNEPLLRNDLERVVKKIKKAIPNAFQLLYTNGILLSYERYLSLLKAGINYFLVTRHDYLPMPDRPFQKIIYPNNLILSNWGGAFFKLKKPLNTPCFSPSDRLVVTLKGDILLCCNDTFRTQVMGNILNDKLENIWYSNTFCEIRNILKVGKRNVAPDICKHCNEKEYSSPGADYFSGINKESLNL